jgi:hypothetical protein
MPQFISKLKSANHSPLIEDDRVTFIYRGTANRVEMIGDVTDWRLRGLVLRDVPGTNIKYLTREFASDARVEYKLITDGKWTLDPLNPDKVDNGVGGFNSFFIMPRYRASVSLGNENARDITLEKFEIASRLLNNSRQIQIYLPPDYTKSQNCYPVLYLQDGSEYAARTYARGLDCG